MLNGQGENKHFNAAKNKKCGLQRVSEYMLFFVVFFANKCCWIFAASEEKAIATDTKQIISIIMDEIKWLVSSNSQPTNLNSLNCPT